MGLLAQAAHAEPAATRDALDRLEEILAMRVEDGRLAPREVVPAILVSVQPRYEASQPWFATRAVEVLQRAFGEGSLRLCEACMAPRAFVGEGHLTYQAGPIGIDEIVRLDDQGRGEAAAARSAIWLDEHRGGVSVRIVDLHTSQVLYAQNVDPLLVEHTNTHRVYSLSAELERRARGDSITQAFVDLSVYPRQHISLDWTDQWGPTNANLSGITLSFIDPVAGIGAVHHHRVEFFDVLVGAKLVVSVPTALSRIIDDDIELLDPMLTGVGIVRVPFGRSNYGAILTVSTNGVFGLGLSLMNISLLPVIP